MKKRGRLAKERTLLANERTLLAYFRTSLAFFALGVIIMKFLSSEYFAYAILSIFFGFVLILYGSRKFVRIKEKINDRYIR